MSSEFRNVKWCHKLKTFSLFCKGIASCPLLYDFLLKLSLFKKQFVTRRKKKEKGCQLENPVRSKLICCFVSNTLSKNLFSFPKILFLEFHPKKYKMIGLFKTWKKLFWSIFSKFSIFFWRHFRFKNSIFLVDFLDKKWRF